MAARAAEGGSNSDVEKRGGEDSTSTAAPRSGSHSSSSVAVVARSPPREKHTGGERKRRGASRSRERRRRRSRSRKPEVKFSHRRTHGEILRCKKAKRTDIKPTEWDTYNYYRKGEVLTRPIQYDEQTVPIRRVKRCDITPEWFHENCAKAQVPIIVEDCLSDWPAMHRWSIDALEERFRQVAFKVAKDDKGKKLRVKFKYYADYIRNQKDDSPLYLFETNMDDNSFIRPLMDDYEVPDIFPHDWMNLLNHDSRPPFRWFCIGPKRSGTTIHKDPLGTAAWNAVTHGCKHWVLFHPDESRRVVKGKDVIRKGEDDEAIMYYDYILPRIKRANPNVRVYEGLQKAGEVIFVPGNWWHGVVNREDCVAVTQNYCGPDNFEVVWKRIRSEREKVAYMWLRSMRRVAPRLYDEAVAMNVRDGFKMRHERGPDDKAPSCSSSGSESSSDSTTDEAADLDPTGLESAMMFSTPGGAPAPATNELPLLGAAAFRLQGPGCPADMSRARCGHSRSRRDRNEGEKKRRREDRH